MQPLANILKQDLFDLTGLAGLMAVRQAARLWLDNQPDGQQVTVLAVKPNQNGCKVMLSVCHSTLLQQWQPQWPALKQHLNLLASQTHWPVHGINCQIR
jgi:hypothetical protein